MDGSSPIQLAEKKQKRTIAFSAASIVFNLQCLYLQFKEIDWPKDIRKKRVETFRDLSTPDRIRQDMSKPGGKGAGKAFLETVSEYLSRILQKPTQIDHGRLIVEVDAISSDLGIFPQH